MITFETLLARAEALGLPLARNEFVATKKNPAPEPPFIIWLRADTARGADNVSNILETNGAFELYTEGVDTALEARLENEVLQDVEYRRFQAPIPSENLTQTAYEVTILQKRRIKP